MCSWKALDVPGSHSHSFIRGFKMQWRRTIAELSWQPPCFAANDCLVWLGKYYTVVDVSSAFLIYIFIPYQLTEWFSPVVLKGNGSPKACVDLAKRETNALTKIFVHKKRVFTHDPLLFYSIKWENRNISHMGYPDIIFLNGALLWSQTHTGVHDNGR